MIFHGLPYIPFSPWHNEGTKSGPYVRDMFWERLQDVGNSARGLKLPLEGARRRLLGLGIGPQMAVDVHGHLQGGVAQPERRLGHCLQCCQAYSWPENLERWCPAEGYPLSGNIGADYR